MLSRPTNVFSPDFSAQLTLWSNQQKQDAVNRKIHDEWLVQAANWILQNEQNRNLNLPIAPAPTLPLMTIYEDDGTVSHPPFPDLRTPILPPVTPAGSGSIKSDNPPPDRTDALLLLAQMLLTDVEAIKKKLGV